MDQDPQVSSSSVASSSPGRALLRTWLNKSMRIVLSDGRVLAGIFLCTDQDSNVILGSCTECLSEAEEREPVDPRILGLAMVPGRHIVSIKVDQQQEPPAPQFPANQIA